MIRTIDKSTPSSSGATTARSAPSSIALNKAHGRSTAHNTGTQTTARGNSAAATTVTAFLMTVTADTLDQTMASGWGLTF